MIERCIGYGMAIVAWARPGNCLDGKEYYALYNRLAFVFGNDICIILPGIAASFELRRLRTVS